MFKILCLIAYVAACQGYAVHPVVPAPHVVPAHVVPAPLVSPYLSHGYYGYGLVPKVHHLYKRSPHYVSPLAHVSPVVFPPVAVSHQARVDAHTAPAVVAAPILPVVKTLSPYVSPLAYGVGHYGHGYAGYGHY